MKGKVISKAKVTAYVAAYLDQSLRGDPDKAKVSELESKNSEAHAILHRGYEKARVEALKE